MLHITMSLCTSHVGATAISKLLMTNCMIQELYINENNIGDDGIAAIATALTNTRINELNVGKCGITLNGAKSLAALLSVNQNIKVLMLNGNDITKEGDLILESSVSNRSRNSFIMELPYESEEDDFNC